MSRSPWTAERKAYVQQRLASGASFSQIAERLGLTWQAVAQGATVYSLRTVCRHGGWSDDRVAKLAQYHADGMSAAEAARALGSTTRNAVIGKWARMGLRRERLDKRSRTPRSVHVPKAVKTPKVAKAPKTPPRPVNDAPRPPTAKTLDYVAALKPGPFSRPWEERGPGQCAWPFGERGAVVSCCAPCGDATYCADHRAIMRSADAAPFGEKRQKFYAGIERIRDARNWTAPIRSWEAV